MYLDKLRRKVVESIINLKEFQTVPVLTEILKTWKIFSDFRIVCIEFPNAPLLINGLVTRINTNIEELPIKELISQNNKYYSNDIYAIELIWNLPFSQDILQIVINIFNENYQVPNSDKELFYNKVHYLLYSDYDPLLKFFLLHHCSHSILKNTLYRDRILRVLGLYFLYKEEILTLPILYHDSHLSSLVSSTKTISEENIILFFKQVQNICISGIFILKIYNQKISEAKKMILEDSALSKLLVDSNFFSQFFEKDFHTISSIMTEFNWKRDKTARLLKKFCQKDILIEKKYGKDKLFINNILFSTFSEIKKNSNINKLIMPN